MKYFNNNAGIKGMTDLQFRSESMPFASQKDLDSLRDYYNRIAPKRLQYYNVTELMGDYAFQCPSFDIARAFADAGLPVIKTYFTKLHVLRPYLIDRTALNSVSHGSDVPFFWQKHSILNYEEVELSRVMVKGLLDFGKGDEKLESSIGKTAKSGEWVRYRKNEYLMTELTCPTIRYMTDDKYFDRCNAIRQIVDKSVDERGYPKQLFPLKDGESPEH